MLRHEPVAGSGCNAITTGYTDTTDILQTHDKRRPMPATGRGRSSDMPRPWLTDNRLPLRTARMPDRRGSGRSCRYLLACITGDAKRHETGLIATSALSVPPSRRLSISPASGVVARRTRCALNCRNCSSLMQTAAAPDLRHETYPRCESSFRVVHPVWWNGLTSTTRSFAGWLFPAMSSARGHVRSCGTGELHDCDRCPG